MTRQLNGRIPSLVALACMALACMALGTLVLIGWMLDIAVLKSPGPTFVTMKANAALAFVLSGIALWQIRNAETPPVGTANRVGQAAAAIVVMIGALTVSEYLFSWNLGIDQLLFRESADAVLTSSPGRMAPNTALAFLAAGIALLLLLRRSPGHERSRGLPFIEGAAGIVTVLGLMALLGYASDVAIGYRWGTATGVPVYSAAGFVALGIGLFATAWRREQLRWTIGTGTMTAFAAALGATIMLIGATYQTTHKMEVTAQRVALANDVRFRVSDLLSAVQDVESAAQGFVLTGEESYLAPSDSAVARMAIATTTLHRLTAHQPEAHSQLLALDSLIAARVDLAHQYIEVRRLRGERAAADIVRTGRGKSLMDAIRQRLAALDTMEARDIAESQEAADAATKWAYLVVPLTGLFTLVVLPLVLLAMNREVVARGKATAVAQRSEEQLRAVFEQTAIGFSLANPDGRLLRVNQQLCDMLGYDRQELEQLRLQDITHPDDQAAGRALGHEVLDGRIRYYTRDKRFVRKDGSAVWINATVSLVRHAGDEPAYFVAAIKDITERKRMIADLAESEERFRLAAAATSNTIWDWNIATDTVWRSVDVPARYGYQEASAPSKAWYITHIHPDDRERVQREIDTALDSSSTLWESEYRFVRADGSAATLRDRAYVVRNDDGTATRMIGSTSDITELVAMQSHMQRAERMETVGQLAGGIAHDFNNLLTVIIGSVDLAVARQRAGEPIREDLDLIRDTATRAADLTRQLLAFSRRQVLQPEVVSLNAVVASIEPMLRRLIGEHVALVVRPAEELGNVFVDATQVQQVVLNMAINARDAMPNGGTLTIATENAMLDEAYTQTHEGARAGPHAMLSVSDDGTGMDEETRKRIFEPFFTTKEPGKGTGLGLTTVYGIVKQSNGYIWVYSEPGRGTIFKVYFPLTASPASEPAPTALPHARAGGQETILVVEDQDDLRPLCVQMLELLDYTVLSAANGADALDVLERHPGTVDLVLTDMVMPGMSGSALAERVRASHPGAKILFTSGYTADSSGLNNTLDAGAFFIGKPYTLDDLERKLREVLDS